MQRFESFVVWFTRVAQALAQEEGDPRLASAVRAVARRQCDQTAAS